MVGILVFDIVGINSLLRNKKDNNSNDEDRFRLLGESAKGFVLLVVHCIRNGDTIRIISARHATNIEKRYYYENNGGRI